MTYAKRTDRNHAEIVQALRKVGCSVQSLAGVGQGVPDLVVGLRGRNVLMEIKSPGQRPNRRQRTWIAEWRGEVFVVQDVDDALGALGL